MASKVLISRYLAPFQRKGLQFHSRSGISVRSFATTDSGSLGRLFEQQVQKYEHKDFLHASHENVRWTFKELQTRVHALGNGLISLRYKPSQKVAFTLGHGVPQIFFQIAATEIGVQFVSTHQDPPPGELHQFLEAVQPRGIVLNSKVYPESVLLELFPELQFFAYGKVFRSEQHPYLREIVRTDLNRINGTIQLRILMAYSSYPNSVLSVYDKVSSDSPAQIHVVRSDSQYKTKVFTHAQIIAIAQQIQKQFKLSTEDRICAAYPLYSPLGHAIEIWGSLLSGSFITLPSSLNLKTVKEVAERDKCNAIIASPDLFGDSLSDISLPSIKKILLVTDGSHTLEPVASELKKQFSVTTFNTESQKFS